MKKRRYIGLFAAVCAALCLGACKPEEAEKPDPYAPLNEMLGLHYSGIVLTVTETFGEGVFLTGEYRISDAEEGKKVVYSVEQFAELIWDGPSEQKTVLSGEAVYSDGFLISRTGDETELPAVLGRGLVFREEYFANAELRGTYFKADVKDVSSFLGADPECTDMKVEATFLEIFYEIGISYVSGGGIGTEYRYRFVL